MSFLNAAPTRVHSRASPCPSHAADLEFARKLHQKHGTSYYFATAFFPKPLREATFALYAFFRVPDELVDNPQSENPRRKLEDWQSEWQHAYQTGEAEHPVLRATAHVFRSYSIPLEYSEDFLRAMLSDLTNNRYETYADLEKYMYGSAAVVGRIMSHVIGFENPAALAFADKLGYAMQLTNFLRDIDEDYVLRQRIYLPRSELKFFGVTPEQIKKRQFDKSFERLMRFQIAHAHRLYDEASEGIALLHPEGRRAVRIASALYRAILTKLENQGCNPFAGRARTSVSEKIRLTASVWR